MTIILILLLSLLACLVYQGYKNYQTYSSYFVEADKYNIEYNKNNYVVFESEITYLEQQIKEAKEEEQKQIEAEKKAAEEAKRAEEVKKAEEERIAKEKAEQERLEKEEQERLAKEQEEKETQNPPSGCEPYYVSGILLVNKNHCLPSSYAPGGLTPETYSAVTTMISDAANNGIYLVIVSGYRSYETQVDTFNYWVNTLGYDEAIKVSAEPGYSEHQTGLALDIGATNGACELETCFYNTPEGQWIANHAHEYGFIIRYPEGQEAITGYTYEPWHLRYVGIDVATQIYSSNITLEEYLGVY